MKRSFAIFMIIVLISTLNIYADEYNGEGLPIPNWEVYKMVNGLDSSLPYVIAKGHFNKELWEEKGVVVYGDYSLVPNNDFKAVWNGYYTKGGTKGEYRFHGYDVNDNKHNNTDFPPDYPDDTPLNKLKYVYHPWEVGSIGYRLYKKYVGERISDYNHKAIQGNKTIAKWINQGTDFNIERVTGTAIPNPSLDSMHYVTVQTAPTPVSTGQGTFVHITNSGKSRYQTVPIKKIADKELTPVEALIPSITVTNVTPDGNVTLKVKVTGELLDDEYFKDEILRSTYYNRRDIKVWKFKLYDNVTKKEIELKGTRLSDKTAYAEFELTMPQSQYKNILKGDSSFDVNFKGTAIVQFYSTSNEPKLSNDDVYKVKNIKGSKVEHRKVEPEIIDISVKPIEFDVSAPREILDVYKFPLNLTIIDDEKAIDMYVMLDGLKLNDKDEEKFLNGQFVFPKIGNDRVYDYSIVFVHENGYLYFYQSFVIVYDSIPRATVRVTDPGKVNRKVTVTSDKSVTSAFLRENSNVHIKSFTVTSLEGQTIYYGTNTNELKEFLIKNPDTVNVSVTVANEYGSRTYTHQLYEGEDIAPDLIAIIWNNNLSRIDKLDMFAEGASMDGDTVTEVNYSIYYDEDKDEEPEKLITSGIWKDSIDYVPQRLGNYKVVLTAKEEFGQETIAQYIKDEDKKETTVEREFFVDNLIPMTKVYSDIEYNFPELDVILLNDESLERTENDYIRDHQVDITNQFRVNSMLANVDIWDLYTYEFTQTAYDRYYSGSSYPPSTRYYSSGGYTGTLARYGDVDNYPYTVDEGQYKTKTESKTVTMSQIKFGPAGTSKKEYPDGGWTDYKYYWAKYSYSDSEGYSGSTEGKGYAYTTYDADGNFVSSGGTNQPTKSGTAYRTVTYWESNYVTHNDYYGNYSGTVYKYVKQSYKPDLSTSSNKYIVYITNTTISNINDFNYVKNIARDSNIILVADASLHGRLNEDSFINYSSNTQQIIDTIINIIKAENPILNEQTLLIGETFDLSHTDLDAEDDPIVEKGYQYIHDANYFDNSLGQESGTFTEYNESQFTSTKQTSFSKPGNFTIYRRIKDEPIDFTGLGKYSNLSTLEVAVHRKPIANATLDWEFDDSLGFYKTSWIDKSYDPDFQYSDASKGIVQRKIKYKLVTDDTWTYEIPDNLVNGTYELEYVVMDKHGVWSDPFVMKFTLQAVPPPQLLDAKAKTELDKFSLNSIPASENLLVYDIVTRHHSDVYLQIALFNNGSEVTSKKTIYYKEGVTATKNGQFIKWNDVIYNIPDTLPDHNYQLRIYAIDKNDPRNYDYKEFDVTIKTPIDIKTNIDQKEVTEGETTTISATTSIYANKVNLTMFYSSDYEHSVNMRLTHNDGVNKYWEFSYKMPSRPKSYYLANFIGSTPNGNTDDTIGWFYLIPFIPLSIDYVDISGAWNHWRGQVDIFGNKLNIAPLRFLCFEKISILAITRGGPKNVYVRFSPELESMYYKNKYGHQYNYHDHVGYNVSFPLSMSLSSWWDNRQTFGVSYILPLADSTIDENNVRIKSRYWVEITAVRGTTTETRRIYFDITGNTLDHIYWQPE